MHPKSGGGLCHCEPLCFFFLLAKIVGHSSHCALLHWKGGDQSSESCDRFWSRTPADRPVFGREDRQEGDDRLVRLVRQQGFAQKKKGVQAAENLRFSDSTACRRGLWLTEDGMCPVSTIQQLLGWGGLALMNAWVIITA